jgi:hypothetical protein
VIDHNQELEVRCARRAYDNKLFLALVDDLEEFEQYRFRTSTVHDGFFRLILRLLNER